MVLMRCSRLCAMYLSIRYSCLRSCLSCWPYWQMICGGAMCCLRSCCVLPAGVFNGIPPSVHRTGSISTPSMTRWRLRTLQTSASCAKASSGSLSPCPTVNSLQTMLSLHHVYGASSQVSASRLALQCAGALEGYW